MQKRISISDILALIVWLAPLSYLVDVYPQLGNHIPTHFDFKGNPDAYGTRSYFIGIILVLSAFNIGIALLIRFLPSIDPKKKARYSQATFIRISHGMIFFMAALTIMIIYSSINGHFSLHTGYILPLVGLFLSYLGNLFNSVKPNYFVGIRTPWTLENDEVWRKTHQLAGRIWLPGGIVLAILGWAVPEPAVHFVFLTGIFIMAFIPIVYSYIYFKRLAQ